MEESRKIQKTGRNTFIVSLPYDWAVKRNISKGSAAYILENPDGSLTLSLKKTGKTAKSFVINVSSKSFELSMRNVVSAYVGGADKVVLRGLGISTLAEEVRRLLSGVEISEETPDELTLQILTFENLSIDNILKRMFSITQSMFSLAMAYYRDGTNVIVEISRKEDEVDRLYLLLLRTLCIGNYTSKEAIFQAITAKSIEKASDHLEDLCAQGKDIVPNAKLAELLDKAHRVYAVAFDSFSKGDLESMEFSEARKEYNSVLEAVAILLRKEKQPARIIALKSLVEECNKVVRYAEDITESAGDLVFAGDYKE